MAHSNMGPPVAGAYIAIPMYLNTLAALANETKTVKLPAGMKIVVVGVTQDAAVATLATVTVGTIADPNGICVSQSMATTASELLLNGALIESDTGRAEIDSELVIVVDTGASTGALDDGIITVWAYVSAHPTNTPGRASTLDVYRKATAGY